MIRFIISVISLITVFFMMFFILNSCNTKGIWSSGTVLEKDDLNQTITVQEDQEVHIITIANKTVYDRIGIREVVYITYEYNINTSSKHNVRLNPSCKLYNITSFQFIDTPLRCHFFCAFLLTNLKPSCIM